MKTSRITVALCLMAIAAVAAAQPGPPAAPVEIAQARLETLAPTAQVPGTVISRNDARLAAEVAGRLVWVAEVGTRIDKDEPVARIDDSDLGLQKEEYEGLVASAESRRGFLDREADRLRRLAAENIAAKNRLDEVESQLAAATSDLAVARARLGQISVQLERTRLRAPFSGVVTQRLLQPGEHTTPGDQVVRLVDPANLEIVARAPLTSLAYVEVGDSLQVSGVRGRSDGPVRTMVPFGDASSHMFEIRIPVEPDPWRVGDTVRVSVPTAEPSQVLAVPRDALVLRRGAISVFRVNEDGTAEQLTVQPGLGSGDMIAVTGPLEPGDRVIVRGAERLRPGQPVQVIGGGA
ncbi:MAG: efflux RND transporter periplasmic adaptor subunit [Gammaproteobacteria bacterium]